jgi:hypothetical protein
MSMVSWGAIVDAGMGGGVPGRSAKVLLLLVVPVASGPVPVVVLELEGVEGFDSRVMVEDNWEERWGLVSHLGNVLCRGAYAFT